MNNRYKTYYKNHICPKLMQMPHIPYLNHYEIPKIDKIIINRGLGEASQNPQILESSLKELQVIGGQKSIITHSRKSISSFKLRQQMPIGVCVTLRNHSMYNFIDRLLNLALPRIRDFQGLPITSFDGFGNYSFGLEEQLMFPEIQYDQIDQLRGMDITIVISTDNDKESRLLLQQFGFPFQNYELDV